MGVKPIFCGLKVFLIFLNFPNISLKKTFFVGYNENFRLVKELIRDFRNRLKDENKNNIRFDSF